MSYGRQLSCRLFNYLLRHTKLTRIHLNFCYFFHSTHFLSNKFTFCSKSVNFILRGYQVRHPWKCVTLRCTSLLVSYHVPAASQIISRLASFSEQNWKCYTCGSLTGTLTPFMCCSKPVLDLMHLTALKLCLWEIDHR